MYYISCHFGSWAMLSFIIAFEAFIAQNHNQSHSIMLRAPSNAQSRQGEQAKGAGGAGVLGAYSSGDPTGIP